MIGETPFVGNRNPSRARRGHARSGKWICRDNRGIGQSAGLGPAGRAGSPPGLGGRGRGECPMSRTGRCFLLPMYRTENRTDQPQMNADERRWNLVLVLSASIGVHPRFRRFTFVFILSGRAAASCSLRGIEVEVLRQWLCQIGAATNAIAANPHPTLPLGTGRGV